MLTIPGGVFRVTLSGLLNVLGLMDNVREESWPALVYRMWTDRLTGGGQWRVAYQPSTGLAFLSHHGGYNCDGTEISLLADLILDPQIGGGVLYSEDPRMANSAWTT